MSNHLNYYIFLIIFKIYLSSPLCVAGSNNCLRCNPITNLCIKCDKNIYKPDNNGGCENAKKCIMGKNQCIECNELGNLCKICFDGYFPDENGGCSYTDNCEISFEGKCIKCKDDYILIGLDNTFIEGIKICKSLFFGDLKNCEKIDIQTGYCEECKEGFFLNSEDHKCTNVENCKESTFDICTKCNNGYYLDIKENKCKLQNETFARCMQTIDSKTCDICEEDYYFDEDKKCNAVNYCAKTINNYRCEKCISGYYLTAFGTECTPEENCYRGNKDLGICTDCKDGYYLDYKDGKCKSNQENNEFKYCYQADGICKKCIARYQLGLDNKCSLTANCAETENGICIGCIENYYLGLDHRCSNVKHCIISNDYNCIECDDNYYYNRTNGTCMIAEGNLKNCKYSSFKEYCEECKNNSYLNKTDNLCYSNEEKGKFYKCAKTNDLGDLCYSCIEGYYLGDKDNKCSKIYGCVLSENENKCIECDEYYCLDLKTGRCESNDEINEKDKKFYFKCNQTNKEGTGCEICADGYTLDDNGLCIDNIHCIEKDEDGKCKKCQKFDFDDINNWYCLNNYFGCVELYMNYKCLECNDLLDFYNCTKCADGYKIDNSGFCEEIENNLN